MHHYITINRQSRAREKEQSDPPGGEGIASDPSFGSPETALSQYAYNVNNGTKALLGL